MSSHQHHTHTHHGDGSARRHTHSPADDNVHVSDIRKGPYEKANEEYYDNHGAIFHTDEAKAIAKQAAEAIREAYVFDREVTTVLDFGCAIGNVSMELEPYCKTIFGVDISGGMVDEYNSIAKQANLDHKMKAYRVDITEGKEVDEFTGKVFDVVFCCLSYHHLTDIPAVTSALGKLVAQDGVLIILDWLPPTEGDKSTQAIHDDGSLPEGMTKETVEKIVSHGGGFSKDQIATFFASGKLDVRDYKPTFTMKMGNMAAPMFIAVGIKQN